VPSLIENWLKKIAFELQEYAKLIGAFFQGAVSEATPIESNCSMMS
jgi:hypothetical protein